MNLAAPLLPTMDSLPCGLGDLTPAGARLALEVRHHLDELGLAPDESVVAGFSGGADSTALVILLRCLGYRVVMAHLDHGLRPESAAEARHASAVAAALGLACEIRRHDVAALASESGQGLEEAGRAVRYTLFDDVRVTHGCGWVATGHHLNDLCEDTLLRLVRGTGWPGLGGMTALDLQRRVVRPLLPFRRERLEAFLVEHRVPWLTDASNADTTYRRNRFRHTLMPLLLAENPRFPESISELNRMARLDEAHWEATLEGPLAAVRDDETGVSLPRTVFAPLDGATRQRLLLALVQRLPRGQARASALRQAARAMGDDARQGTGKRFQLPGGGEIRLEKDHVLVKACPMTPSRCV